MIYGVKPAFRAALRGVERALVAAGVSADALTIAGVAFAACGGLGIWLGRDGGVVLLVVPVAVFLRTAANALDGMVATTTGTARPAGLVLNETADRVADVAVFLPMALVPGVPDLLVAGALAMMLTTSCVGLAVQAAGGPRLYAGPMGKPDRMAVVGVAALVAVWGDPERAFSAALWVVLVGGGFTLLRRAHLARRALTNEHGPTS